MRQRSSRRFLWVGVAWSLLMLALAVVIAVQAAASLYDGQQACFFAFPVVPCPSNDDPAIARLTFAFFGVPVIWLVGIGLVTLAWARQRRRARTAP
jgi:hypothetical protein